MKTKEELKKSLTEEINDLEIKEKKLATFLNGIESDKINKNQYLLLWIQLSVMRTYKSCLESRMENLEREE